MKKTNSFFSREDCLRAARLIVEAPEPFTQEREARMRGFAMLAERLPSETGKARPESRARTAYENFLRYGHEKRDLSEAAAMQTTATSVLVQQGFHDALMFALRQYDRLFDPDVCTVIETDTGAPYVLPFVSDVDQEAVLIPENTVDPTGTEGSTAGDPALLCQVGQASTFRAKIVRMSRELVTDSAFDIVTFLSRIFAIRISRGLGAALVSTLLGEAITGATAQGSSKNTGGNEDGSTSIGWADLAALVASVDPAYRALPKCGWLMNSSTLLALDSIITKQGVPMIRELYNSDGDRMLLGYPVAYCPSMPNIGAGNLPIAFGALEYFVTRLVKQATDCQTFWERYAEYFQVGYSARMRGNGTLMGVVNRATSPVTQDSPIKLLANAAS